MEPKTMLPGGIRVSARSYWWGIHLEYTGNLDALVTAGCITQYMAEAIRRPSPSKGRRDEHGFVFRSSKLPRKKDPERYQVIRTFSDDNSRGERCAPVTMAIGLPGVTTLYPLPKRDTARIRTQKMRQVGRTRRDAKWTTKGDVIHIDWIFVQAQAGTLRRLTDKHAS